MGGDLGTELGHGGETSSGEGLVEIERARRSDHDLLVPLADPSAQERGRGGGAADIAGADKEDGRHCKGDQRTISAMVRRVSVVPATKRVVAIDSFQASRSSRIFSLGPIRATSSMRAVGTAAAASSLWPSR